MDTLKQQLLRIQQQLAGLSASQKMLTASLVAIMVMTLFYWSRYSGTAEQVSLIEQAISPEEMAQVKSALQAKGIQFTLQGDKIMVPPDAKFGILSDLSYEQSLPRDMKGAFDEIVNQMSPLDSNSKTEAFYNHAREKTLQMMISRWPGVKQATVIIDNTRNSSPLHHVEPSATVNILLKSGEEGSKKLADSARVSVAGAQAGLKPENVTVLIDGRTFTSADPANPFSGDNSILKSKQDYEQYYSTKIIAQLGDIPNVRATVSVKLQTSSSESTSRTLDLKNKLSMPAQETTSTTDTNAPSPSNEPGAVPNIGTPDAPASSPGSTTHNENSEIKFQNDNGWKNEITHAPAGDATAVTASVRIPESYLRRVWKSRNPSANRDPGDADLDAIVKRESQNIRDAVKSATNVQDDAAIYVASYVDIDPIPAGEPAAAGLATLPMTVGFGAKEIAIGALAVVSLFMVSMMVRKSAPQPQLAMLGSSPQTLGSALDAISAPMKDFTSEVSEGGAMLTGHELTDEAIESRSVIDQVDAMVKANPDAAANLLKQWMNQD